MLKRKRINTEYPGVYYFVSTAIGSNKPEKVYYIMYRKKGVLINEKAGRQYQDDMTPARASHLRARRIEGKELANKERRLAKKASKIAEQNKWTIYRLWESYKSHKDNFKGFVTDENRFNNHISPVFGDKEPREIDSLSVHRFRKKLLNTRKPGTVKNVLELLRRIINYGIKNNLCDGINFTIKMPQFDNETTDDLSPEQLASLLHEIEHSDNIIAASMMLTALYSGMRRGEMFKLQWSDVDFDHGFIYLRNPKGNTTQRIPMNTELRQVFMRLPQTSDYVFPGKNGSMRVDIKRAVNAIKKAADLPKEFRPLHGLRHVYASMLASSGKVDMYTLQKLLTHKGPAMTQRYAHLRDDALKKASELAGNIISNAAKGQMNDNNIMNIK